jgi:putative redox protein
MRVTFQDNKRITAEINGFSIQTDQPKKSGGLGENPNPFDFFKASIGCCMSYYVMAFCLERQIPIDNIWVDFNFIENKTIEIVEATINVGEDFPEEYLGAIQKSTRICKIKRSYSSPPDFVVKVNKEN